MRQVRCDLRDKQASARVCLGGKLGQDTGERVFSTTSLTSSAATVDAGCKDSGKWACPFSEMSCIGLHAGHNLHQDGAGLFIVYTLS